MDDDSTELATWCKIYEVLSDFPKPELAISRGEVITDTWAFRGQPDERFELEPTLERSARERGIESWSELELFILPEFRARARSHLKVSLLPDEDSLTWLSLMRHYGVPTRLLDFTYSPFVALYFAIRGGLTPSEEKNLKKAGPKSPPASTASTRDPSSTRTHVGLWAVDTRAVNARFESVVTKPKNSTPEISRKLVSWDPDDFSRQRDRIADHRERFAKLIEGSLSARGKRRGELNRRGCVCATLPSEFNPRLASQQGLFMINCAEELSFRDSLTKMMKGCSEWKKTFKIPIERIPEIEERLFQMNIHEQALFPDLEGLAGFIQQKVRLHWSGLNKEDDQW
jgi:FRG domain-containing protein